MSASIKQNARYISVVGTADLDKGTGRLRYVNPISVATLGVEPACSSGSSSSIELVALDAQGTVLAKHPLALRTDSCDHESLSGLIQVDIPVVEHLSVLSLRIDGQEVDSFQAAAPVSNKAGADTTPGLGTGLTLGPVPVGHPARRDISTPDLSAQPGASYNILVQPDGKGPWQAIRVGAKTGEVNLDARQFPGATRLHVKVIRSRGFEEETAVEQVLLVDDTGALTAAK